MMSSHGVNIKYFVLILRDNIWFAPSSRNILIKPPFSYISEVKVFRENRKETKMMGEVAHHFAFRLGAITDVLVKELLQKVNMGSLSS